MKTRWFTHGGTALAMCSAMVVCLLFGGCRKEEGAMRFSLFTEAYSGGAKVTVDGLTSSWRAGDHVKVNGVEGAVGVDAQGQPYLDVTVSQWGGSYYAAYPASAVESCTESGLLTLTLPQEYQYREDNSGHQLLELPMVACSDNSSLVFKHLTGALVVKVPHADRNIVLDYIMVKSSTSPLSGRGTVQVDAANPQVTFSSDTTHTVVMFFDRCPVTILSSATETKDIMIPVAPTTGERHKFTVTVCAHSTGSTRYYYLFNKESTIGNMERNVVAGALVPTSDLQSQSIPFLGDGSVNNPYLIQNKQDYKNFLDYLNTSSERGGYYKLVNDIDFGGDTLSAVTSEHGFYGKFNGNGKRLSNVAVVGTTYQVQNYFHFISVFPAITGGWVKNLSVSNVRLIAPQSGSLYTIYLGGFSSYVKSYSDGVSLENISVSDISVNMSFRNLSVSSVVSMGGIVGTLTKQSNTSQLAMNSCRFVQTELMTLYDSAGSSMLCFGGMIGDAKEAKVTLTDCQVNLGGNQDITGTFIRTSCSQSCVGAAIGRGTSSTVQMVNSLLLEGKLQFLGNPNTFVKRVMGSSATVSGKNLVSADSLYVWKKSDPGVQYSQVTDNY